MAVYLLRYHFIVKISKNHRCIRCCYSKQIHNAKYVTINDIDIDIVDHDQQVFLLLQQVRIESHITIGCTFFFREFYYSSTQLIVFITLHVIQLCNCFHHY